MKENKDDIPLDKALRYIYHALRYVGEQLVAIEFRHKGKTWRADTPEEALRLREQLETAELREHTAHGHLLTLREQNVWAPDTFLAFVNSIGPAQASFLRLLLKHPELLLPSEKIIKALGLKKETEFAGVLSGLSKQLKKLNLRPHQLYFVDVEWHGKDKYRAFGIDFGFELTAQELGWPEK